MIRVLFIIWWKLVFLKYVIHYKILNCCQKMERKDEKSAFQYFYRFFFHFCRKFLFHCYFSMFCFWVKYTLRYRQRIIWEIRNLPAPKDTFTSNTVNNNMLKTSFLVSERAVKYTSLYLIHCKLICYLSPKLVVAQWSRRLPLKTNVLRFSITPLAFNEKEQN